MSVDRIIVDLRKKVQVLSVVFFNGSMLDVKAFMNYALFPVIYR